MKMYIKEGESKKFFLSYNLSFFEGEKTEKPTPKRRSKARSEGQVAKSQEISTAFLFLVSFTSLRNFGPGMYNKIMEIFNHFFILIGDLKNLPFDSVFMSRLGVFAFTRLLLIVMPLLLMSLIVGLIVNFLQVGWHPTFKPLTPKLSKLDPLKGFKRLFSFKQLLELVKSLFKFAIIAYAIYTTIEKEISFIPLLVQMTILEGFTYIATVAINLGLKIGQLYLLIAILDYIYRRFKHDKDLKMSKEEVKEEFKQAEGNPQVKGKIRQKMREASMRRMMQEVPKADVIITNPTHYAVAIKYDRQSLGAPVVIAKGVDYLAKKIREKATETSIEVVENVQLARALYNTVDLGSEIPPELYQSVAEILAFVYKLKNKV